MSEDSKPTTQIAESGPRKLRRRILLCLEEHVSLTLADLADELAIWEGADSLEDVPPAEVRDLYMDIYQRHLPELEDEGWLVYEQERDLVSLPGYGADASVDIQQVIVENPRDADNDE